MTCQNHWQTRGFSHDWIDCLCCCERQLDRVAVEQTDFPGEPHNDTALLLDWQRCIQSSLHAFHKGLSFMSFWERGYALVDRGLFHICNSRLTINCKIPYAYRENEDWSQSVTTPIRASETTKINFTSTTRMRECACHCSVANQQVAPLSAFPITCWNWRGEHISLLYHVHWWIILYLFEIGLLSLHGTVRSQVKNERDSLQMQRTAVNIMNKESQAANKGWTKGYLP